MKKYFVHVLYTNGRTELLCPDSESQFKRVCGTLLDLLVAGNVRAYTPYMET